MRMTPALIITLFLAVGTAPCRAQDGKAPAGTITTVGAATVQVHPDSVRVTFGHQVRMSGLKESRVESDKQVKRIGDALQSLKIDTLKIVTATDNLQVVMSANPAAAAAPVADMPLVPTGYVVKTFFTVTAKAKELEALRGIAKRITDAAVESGANLGPTGTSVFRDDIIMGGGPGGFAGRNVSRAFVPAVEIFKEDTIEARKLALSAAVKNALATADALASGANTKVRKINAISEDFEMASKLTPNDSDDSSLISALLIGGPRQEPSTSARTVVSITVRVRVTCTIE